MKNKEIKKLIYITITLNMLHNLTVLFGGRGMGKTFNILRDMIEYVHNNPGRKFIWLRDNDKVVQKVAAGQSLTAPIEHDYHEHPERYSFEFPHIEFVKKEGSYTFAEVDTSNNDVSIFGYLMALSTFKNSRGVDYSDVDYIVMDEFIPEEGAIVKRHQGTTFLNMYETVNRNRELEGLPPVKIILLTNTNDIFSDILESLGISGLIENMVIKGNTVYKDEDIWIEFLENREFTEAKKKTFIYRINKNEKFNNMAIKNEFNISLALIQYHPNLKDSKPLIILDGRYTLLQLKNGNFLWVERLYNSKNLLNYDMDNDQEAILFRLYFTDKLRKNYIIGRMYFDSIYTQRNVLDLAKM